MKKLNTWHFVFWRSFVQTIYVYIHVSTYLFITYHVNIYFNELFTNKAYEVHLYIACEKHFTTMLECVRMKSLKLPKRKCIDYFEKKIVWKKRLFEEKQVCPLFFFVFINIYIIRTLVFFFFFFFKLEKRFLVRRSFIY